MQRNLQNFSPGIKKGAANLEIQTPLSPGRANGLSAYEQYSVQDSAGQGDGSYRSGLGNGTKGIQNHYEVPNLSSMLYEFTNKERDRVFAAFRVGNYNSLRELPRHLMPGNISMMHKSKIEQNLFTPVEEKSYIELQSGGGYFSKFDYKSDPYENYLDSLRRDKERADLAQH